MEQIEHFNPPFSVDGAEEIYQFRTDQKNQNRQHATIVQNFKLNTDQ